MVSSRLAGAGRQDPHGPAGKRVEGEDWQLPSCSWALDCWGPNPTDILEKRGKGMSNAEPGVKFAGPSNPLSPVPSQPLVPSNTPIKLLEAGLQPLAI